TMKAAPIREYQPRMTSTGATTSPTYTPYARNDGNPLEASMPEIPLTPLESLAIPWSRISPPSIRRSMSLAMLSLISLERGGLAEEVGRAAEAPLAGVPRPFSGTLDHLRRHVDDETLARPMRNGSLLPP